MLDILKDMKVKIRSYKELLEHQERLKVLLDAKKDLIRSEVDLLKIQTKPMSDLFGKLSHAERKQRLLAIGVGFATKTVIEKIIMARVGWVVRLVAPYLAENSRVDLKKLMKKFIERTSSILKKSSTEADGLRADHEKPRQ